MSEDQEFTDFWYVLAVKNILMRMYHLLPAKEVKVNYKNVFGTLG